MVMQLLKQETKPLHDSVEKVGYVKEIMSGTLSIQQYQDLILKNYLFHAISEVALKEYLVVAAQKNYHYASKLGYLIQDMEELGLLQYQGHFEAFTNDFSLSDFHQALGLVYVIEGATLGGNIIKRELSKNEEIISQSSFSYFGCYGKETGLRWKLFCDFAESQVNHEQERKSMLEGAKMGFKLIETIMAATIGAGASANLAA